MSDILIALLAAAGLALDQWLKAYVTANIPLGQAQPLVPGLVELRTVHNYGAAWSSFSGMRWLLVAVTCCIVCGCVMGAIYYLWLYEKYDKKDKTHGDSDTPTE